MRLARPHFAVAHDFGPTTLVGHGIRARSLLFGTMVPDK
jgi:hypothetical protein